MASVIGAPLSAGIDLPAAGLAKGKAIAWASGQNKNSGSQRNQGTPLARPPLVSRSIWGWQDASRAFGTRLAEIFETPAGGTKRRQTIWQAGMRVRKRPKPAPSRSR